MVAFARRAKASLKSLPLRGRGTALAVDEVTPITQIKCKRMHNIL